ncbi:MAG TPA: response regulator [Bacteroidetes bacterium]|nr:alkaline phosphatase synthesis transcriptional regulatory protein PhoP [bacterium BMS3Bbin04]HDO64419.1 response regulator [Bacteroidota bacterium]HEX03544.1 response regulator [Bacteroidota bacterium]
MGDKNMEDKRRILIVDDEADTRTYFRAILSDNGYDVTTACDGVEGMTKVQEQMPDLITLDLSMPEKSGLKFYRELRESAIMGKIPVVMISGVSADMKEFISSRKQVQAPDGYLTKPIDPDEMLKLVAKLLSASA